jgi:hypothetical protein
VYLAAITREKGTLPMAKCTYTPEELDAFDEIMDRVDRLLGGSGVDDCDDDGCNESQPTRNGSIDPGEWDNSDDDDAALAA